MNSTQQLDIPKKLRPRLETALVGQLIEAVEAVDERDEIFERWDMQLRGDPMWAGIRPRWRGGSNVEDPLTREHHLTIVANMMSVLRQEEWWAVTPTVPGDEQDASTLEAWLNDHVTEHDLCNKIAYQLAYNAGRHSYGMLYAGWRQKYSTDYSTVYVDSETGETVPEEARLPDRKYRQSVEVFEEVEAEGMEFRVPHAADCGTWPPTAQCVQDAVFVWERMDMTADELLDGVEDEGYDPDAVKRLLACHPDGNERTERRRDRDESDGIAGAGDCYQVYVVIGRCPLLMEDGEALLKPDQRRRDYLWMVHVESGIVFKWAPCPYKRRPYIKFPFLDEPGRMIGDGVCSLLGPLQLEATLATRFRVDVRDVAMSPTLLVPDDSYDELQRFSIYPGAMLPFPRKDGPQSIQPLLFDKSGFGAALNDANDFRFRAAQMFSAQARGSVNPAGAGGASKTATQVANESAGADEKFDLVLLNFSTGIDELGEVIVSHTQQFGAHLLSGDPQLAGNRAIALSPELLKKKFRISATGTNEGANATVRVQRAMTLYEMVTSNPLVQMKAQQGDWTAIWTVSTKVARLLGVRDPRSLFGQEPTPPPNGDQLLAIVEAALMQFAQAGDPGAVRTLMILQQYRNQSGQAQMSPAIQSGGPQAGPPMLAAAGG